MYFTGIKRTMQQEKCCKCPMKKRMEIRIGSASMMLCCWQMTDIANMHERPSV